MRLYAVWALVAFSFFVHHLHNEYPSKYIPIICICLLTKVRLKDMREFILKLKPVTFYVLIYYYYYFFTLHRIPRR